jgi:hypothetical protein
VLPVGLAVGTIEVEEDVDSGPPGVLSVAPTVVTMEVEEDVDGGPPRGAAGSSDSSHNGS